MSWRQNWRQCSIFNCFPLKTGGSSSVIWRLIGLSESPWKSQKNLLKISHSFVFSFCSQENCTAGRRVPSSIVSKMNDAVDNSGEKKNVTYRNRTPVGHVANVELRRPKQEIEGQRQEESTQQELNQHQSRAESVVMYHGRQIFPWHCNNTTLTLNKLHIPRVVKRRLGYRRQVLWLPLVNSLTSERTLNDSLLGAWERRTMAQWGEQ